VNEFYAHTDPEEPFTLPEDGANWQPLLNHLQNTAELTRTFAESYNAVDWGYLAGLWHDIGKYSDEFQRKLRDSADAHIEQTSRVQHAIVGAQQSFDKWDKGEGKLLAYVIAGHHTGLPDGASNDDSSLTKRLQKKLEYRFHIPAKLLDQTKPIMPFFPTAGRAGFEVSFFVRMLFSALVDADFLDTERHMEPTRAILRSTEYRLSYLEQKLSGYLETLESRSGHGNVARIRSEVLLNCREAAKMSPGLFSLTVPTGGGKTLSSMAFALKHAIRFGLSRIIYVIPFTSIIEQNASIFREIFSDEHVLEHHSNFEPKEEDHRTRLASENWDAPIVVTTNVQFFESLFAYRSSRCRKLHNIANSVIVLDEVQALPSEVLYPCVESIRELALHYNCSLVLCSATQPTLQKRDDFTAGLVGVREIAPDPRRLAVSLKRVNAIDLGFVTDEELALRLGKQDRVMCILNTRAHARDLYERLVGSAGLFHLSASLCPIDRSRILQSVRNVLSESKPCRVISTQLIEAGVDIDFPVVYRAIAGIDSIAQAAGRCNREGLLESGNLFVFRTEHPLPPGHLRQTAQTAQSILSRFQPDFLSLEAIEEYFRSFYWSQGDRLDEQDILPMLQQGVLKLDFPFRQITRRFRLIDEDYRPVVVPRGMGPDKLIRQIQDASSLRDFSRRLQQFTVQINQRDWSKLHDAGCITIVREIFPVLVCGHLYNDETGLDIRKLINPNPEDLIS
jgi:CRISPR-associated endonuclease/helicase Cas3